MIRIQRMVVKLPASMRPQANKLIRQAARQLADNPQSESRNIRHLNAGTIQAHHGASTPRTAQKLSETIQNKINQHKGT